MKANPRVGSTSGLCQGLVPVPTLHRLHQVSIQYIRLHPGCCSNRHWNLSTLLLHVQHLSIHQSINPPIRQSVNLSIHQSVNPSICQPINPSIRQSINLRRMPILRYQNTGWRQSGMLVLQYNSLKLPCTGSPAWPYSCASRVSQEFSHPMESRIPNYKLRDTRIPLASFPAPI